MNRRRWLARAGILVTIGFAAHLNCRACAQMDCLLLGKKKMASFFQAALSGSDAQRFCANSVNRTAWMSDG